MCPAGQRGVACWGRCCCPRPTAHGIVLYNFSLVAVCRPVPTIIGWATTHGLESVFHGRTSPCVAIRDWCGSLAFTAPAFLASARRASVACAIREPCIAVAAALSWVGALIAKLPCFRGPVGCGNDVAQRWQVLAGGVIDARCWSSIQMLANRSGALDHSPRRRFVRRGRGYTDDGHHGQLLVIVVGAAAPCRRCPLGAAWRFGDGRRAFARIQRGRLQR